MTISYTYDESDNLVLAEAVGGVSVPEFLEYTDDVYNDQKVKPGFIEVLDLSGVTDMEISYNTAQELSQSWDKWKDKSHKGSIIYAPTDLTFGTLRMLQSLMEAESGSDQKNYLVTRNKDNLSRLIRNMKENQESLYRCVRYLSSFHPEISNQEKLE